MEKIRAEDGLIRAWTLPDGRLCEGPPPGLESGLESYRVFVAYLCKIILKKAIESHRQAIESHLFYIYGHVQ